MGFPSIVLAALAAAVASARLTGGDQNVLEAANEGPVKDTPPVKGPADLPPSSSAKAILDAASSTSFCAATVPGGAERAAIASFFMQLEIVKKCVACKALLSDPKMAASITSVVSAATGKTSPKCVKPDVAMKPVFEKDAASVWALAQSTVAVRGARGLRVCAAPAPALLSTRAPLAALAEGQGQRNRQ